MLQAACVDVKRFEGFFKNPLSLKDVSLMFHCSYVSHPSLWMMKGGEKKLYYTAFLAQSSLSNGPACGCCINYL